MKCGKASFGMGCGLIAALLGLSGTMATAQVGGGIGFGSGQFPRPGAPTDTAKYKVTGTVVNALTGEAIPRALVQLQGMVQNAMLTDGYGQFTFEGVNGGAFINATARKPGYFADMEMGRGPVRFAPTPVGPDMSPLVIKLTPAAVLTGRVTGSDGEPLDNAQVRLFTQQMINGRKRWTGAQGGATDEDGRYRIGNLRPGTYVVAVTAPRTDALEPPSGPPQPAYPPMWFFPNSAERSAAALLEIAPGQNQQADLQVPLLPVFRVAGNVMHPPNTSMSFEVIDASGERTAGQGRTFPNGRFELRPLPAGSYTLHFTARDNQGHVYESELPLMVAANVENLNVSLSPAPVITVHITTESTKQPAQGVQAGVGFRSGQQAQVSLEPVEPPFQTFFMRQEGTPDHPEWVIRDARPGRYTVRVQSFGGNYVASATCGNTDLVHMPLTLPASGQLPPIEVTLRDDGGFLSIRPSNDVPANGAQALVFPEGDTQALPLVAFIPPPPPPNSGTMNVQVTRILQGNLGNLAPGEYSVLAFDRIDGLEYANPEAMRKYMPRAAHATISAGGRTSVTVDVITQDPQQP